GRLNQVDENTGGFGISEIHTNAALVAAEHRPPKRAPVFHTALPPRSVAELRMLDLDDFGPKVAQNLAGRRACNHVSEFKNPDARERAFGLRALHWLPSPPLKAARS